MACKFLQSVLCLCLSPLLVAQEAADPAIMPNRESSASAHAVSAASIKVPKGTEVNLVLLESISSATAKKGQTVHMAVAQDVEVDGTIVIPGGAPANGIVTHLRKAVPGKNDGYVELKGVGLTLPNGTPMKLSEYPPGEDACGDFGPCWVMFPVFGAIDAIFAPLFAIRLIEGHDYNSKFKPQGKDVTRGPGERFSAYTARALTEQLQKPISQPDPGQP